MMSMRQLLLRRRFRRQGYSPRAHRLPKASGTAAGPLRRLPYAAFDLAVVLTGACVLLLFGLRLYGEQTLAQQADKLLLPQSTVLLAADGSVMSRIPIPGGGYRENAESGELPPLLLETVMAVEDRRFYEHKGLDYRGLARALASNVSAMRVEQGGSGITQQLARSLFLSRKQTVARKLKEAAIAMALERHLSKAEILRLYLNETYLGRGQYGVKRAAFYYFGVRDLKELTPAQVALLAGIPKGPSIYNPVDRPELAVKRMQEVLGIMKSNGLITAAEERRALQIGLHGAALSPGSAAEYSAAGYVDAALQEASARTGIPLAKLREGGYTVTTGLNPSAQRAAEAAFRNPANFPPDAGGERVQGAVVILDSRTGEVKAMVGGRDETGGGLNRAVSAARQPGSAIKPILVYGPALESGRFTPDSLLPDRPASYGGYSPGNIKGVYRGTVTMNTAVERSINAPAVWLLNEVGVTPALAFAAKLGIELPAEDRQLAIALGGTHGGVSPLQMAQAYGVFASGGRFSTGHLVREVRDGSGHLLYQCTPESQQVISARTAEMMTAMLVGAVNEGTGRKARLSGRMVAGKTGTTQLDIQGVPSAANRDAWFAGYTKGWSAAVWIGFDRTDRNHYMTDGGGTAAALFAAIMGPALNALP
ncbi:transglycosylase domain-containing protein [Paenibacillus stellifer]|uniref:transglycosylase domain-containing protein n=1 Tax=Paenibacillus stellifer TaxID=169760 RepID=UPI000A717A13|nr:PBP1A family penicillin-binding protein [Paenibacillus stellifer]